MKKNFDGNIGIIEADKCKDSISATWWSKQCGYS